LERSCRASGRKLWTIPHGPLHLYRDDTLTDVQARQTLGVPLDAPTALFFGSIRPYKGLDVLLRAFAKVRDRVPNAQLIIAGRPWENFDAYQRIIEEFGLSDRVRIFLGYIPTEEVKLYFSAADLVVLPYRSFAAQSGVGLTAAAFGKPVVVSRVGGLPDLQGDARWVVEPNDPSSLADAMALALENREELERQSAAARRRCEEMSWEDIAERTLAVYRDVCRRGRS
jgi:glycosyltransferase involved in cell wall biosynthesis